MVDGTILSDTGVDVIFARAKARHVGGGRRVPYRIYLGALSLTAGHVGLDFAAVVERLTATGNGARLEIKTEVPVKAPVETPMTPVEGRAGTDAVGFIVEAWSAAADASARAAPAVGSELGSGLQSIQRQRRPRR